MRRRRLEIEAKLSRDDEKQSEREVLNSVRSTAKFTSSWSHMGEAVNTVDYETSVFDPDTEEREKNREHLAELEAMDLPQETKVECGPRNFVPHLALLVSQLAKSRTAHLQRRPKLPSLEDGSSLCQI